MKFPENASFLSPKQVNWCGIAPYFAVNTQIRSGTATGTVQPKTKLSLEARRNNPRHPPAGVAGRPILPSSKFEQKASSQNKTVKQHRGFRGFLVAAGGLACLRGRAKACINVPKQPGLV